LVAAAAAASSGAVVQVWEDDPEPAVLVQRPTPDLSRQPLAFAFDASAPPPDIYTPGTPEFRYWTAAEALRRGADFWARVTGLTQWQVGPTLNVILDEGEQLNAYYDRNALNFFHGQGVTGTVYSGESPDIVCHEMGHAVLDSLKPELFDAATAEAPAFHEAFADLSAILSALQLPTLCAAILSDTGGRLYINSRLSRLAEQLGSAIRLQMPDQAERDCLRNAVNAFVYQDPVALPQSGPVSQLSSEPHNFSRVFTGAAFEILAGMVSEKTAGKPTPADLPAAAEDFAKILVTGVRQAPIVANWYSQVAAAMIDASATVSDAYPAILRAIFVRRSILSLDSAANVASLAKAATATPAAAAPLTDLALPAGDYGLDRPLIVSAAQHPRSFIARAAATQGNGALEPPSSSTSARAFVDDLFTQGRVDYGEFKPARPHFNHGRRICTHFLVRNDEGVRLKRRAFDCGLAV
jgi:hypothetical protein